MFLAILLPITLQPMSHPVDLLYSAHPNFARFIAIWFHVELLYGKHRIVQVDVTSARQSHGLKFPRQPQANQPTPSRVDICQRRKEIQKCATLNRFAAPRMFLLGLRISENRHSSIVQGCWEPKRNIVI